MWLLIAVVGDMLITWHASGYCRSTAGRVGSHAHHNLSDQECLAETLLENTAYDGMSPPLVICECTQSVRREGHGKDVTTIFHSTTVSSCDNPYLYYRDMAKTDPKPRPVAR
jgi:hypothetical protein